MTQLMAGGLDSSILDEFGHFSVKHARRLVSMRGKVWMMPCVALDAYTPALLGHAKHERPSILRIQVCVSQHQKTLVLL